MTNIKLMKRYLKALMMVALFALYSCVGVETTEEHPVDSEMDQLNDLMEEMEDDPVPESADFTLEIPERMLTMTELNPDAEAQYGYVEEIVDENGESKVLENYVIVMMETKEEMEAYEVQLDWDAKSYRDNVIESLRDGVDKFIVETENPEIQEVNGMDCVKNEMIGTLETRNGPIELFYKLGVFEGEKAFYQVLTWCVGDQREEFEADMDRMINSFEENN